MRYFVFIIICLVSCGLSGVVTDQSCIEEKFNDVDQEKKSFLEWDSDQKLDWSDFTSIPDSLNQHRAMTFTKIKTKVHSYSIDSIVYDVYCYFDRDLSWTKDKNSQELLDHEQGHFDISELVTRKLRKEYSKMNISDIEPSFEKLTSVFNKYAVNEKNKVNNLYDRETKHGIIPNKQKEWELMIAKELKALDAYSSTRVVIKRW
jgi:hypothetical protein